MKRIKSLLLCAVILCLGACACTPDTPEDTSGVNTQISDYLYAVEYDDYDLEANVEHSNSKLLGSYPACSEVRKGRFVGRNLDWYINNDAAAVIKVNGNADRYASIGMVGCCPEFSKALAESGEYDEIYKYLPFKTVDGINEKGLYIGVNVMPTGETSFDPTTWEPYAYGHGAAHTNPSSDMHYCVNYLVRIVLDRAGSVEEAKKVIDGIDWDEPRNFPFPGYSQALHWLICDAGSSVVLEFVDNKAVYTAAPSTVEPSLGNIMTNFTNCIFEKDLIQIYGCGYERWELLANEYPSTPATFEGMEELMSKVWYSRAFEIDPSSHDFWFSDWYDLGYTTQDMYKNYALCEDPTFLKTIRNAQEYFRNPAYWHVDDSPLWYTTHTAVYDLKAKTFHVLVHEGRDSQKDYYEASLTKSKFAKPLK